MPECPWKINDHQVIETPEVSFLVFHNNYPEGKQGGIEIIQHGERVATNGDLRLEHVPDQWSQWPEVKTRFADQHQVRVGLAFSEKRIAYTVHVTPEVHDIHISVDFDSPIPDEYSDQLGFNLELLPAAYNGKTCVFIQDETKKTIGTFPHQANGPIQLSSTGKIIPITLGRGKHIVIAPEDQYHRMEIRSEVNQIEILDGRSIAQNNWFILRSGIEPGATKGAIQWVITPGRVSGWIRPPMILCSQVGYHPRQEKKILIELDPHVDQTEEATLIRIDPEGSIPIYSIRPEMLGRFLKYKYASFDISDVRQPGIYQVKYGLSTSPVFRIDKNIYQEGVWQPTLETFMPVQMCHMRVEDVYRVWHGDCHLDDAIQAPIDHEHFDGYKQYEETETPYKPFDHISGLNQGGWHDAGDYDLATGSQASTTYTLALIYDTFHLNHDQTTVLHKNHFVKLHMPDGLPDVIQQIIHGINYLLSGYRIVGHSLAGIIEGNLKQYVHLGDAATMTDNKILDFHHKESEENHFTTEHQDRWVFTNQDTRLEYLVAAVLAASSRVLRGFDEQLADESLRTALLIWHREQTREPVFHPGGYIPNNLKDQQVLAAVELLITTKDEQFLGHLLKLIPHIELRFGQIGWAVVRILPFIDNEDIKHTLQNAALVYQNSLQIEESQNPFNLPFGEGWLRANRIDFNPFDPEYHPPIWGIGWNLQSYAVHYFYLVQTYPKIFNREALLRVLNYVLGCHPANNLSLVSGVGHKSLINAYGTNRAEWSYIPGGVASGPSLIRPDILELMDPWPWLWQQKEYVISGAVTYIFLVLAADFLLNSD